MITAGDIAAAARRLGIRADDTLYVHAGLQHALRVEGRTREAKLTTLVDGLRASVPAGVLMMPTYTYSFTSGEPFDVAATPSTVGVLTEFFRGLDGVRRTADPMFSSAVLGDLPAAWADALYAIGDTECFGPRSVFAHLVDCDAALLFLGVGFEMCTLVMHAEKVAAVPYRYDKDFPGAVLDSGAGIAPRAVTARYFVRPLDADADVEPYFVPLGEALLAGGRACVQTLPRGPRLYAVRARDVVDEVRTRLRDEPDFLLRRGHPAAVAEASR